MSLEPWTLLSEETVVRDRWMDLRRQHVRLPSGHELKDFYVYNQPDWCHAVAVTPEDRFVRVHLWRQGARAFSTEFPGGVIDPGETPEQAAARELLEETGYAGDAPVRLLTVWANPANQTNRVSTVLITGCRRVADPKPEASEAFELDEVDAATLLADVRSGHMANPYMTAAVCAVWLHRPELFEDRP